MEFGVQKERFQAMEAEKKNADLEGVMHYEKGDPEFDVDMDMWRTWIENPNNPTLGDIIEFKGLEDVPDRLLKKEEDALQKQFLGKLKQNREIQTAILIEGDFKNIELLSSAMGLTNRIARAQQKEFWELLDDYQDKHGPIGSKITEYLKQNGLDSPRFIITNSRAHIEKLYIAFLRKHAHFSGDRNEITFPPETDKPIVYVVFNLPKPLAAYWFKGGADSWGKGAMNIHKKGNKNLIEWGHFYRELMPICWGEVDDFNTEQKRFHLERLNDIGEHDPKLFYYIWSIEDSWSE